MSAPDKDEILEQYAAEIGMTETEMIRFCTLVLEDKGYAVIFKSTEPREEQPMFRNSHYAQFRLDMLAAGFDVQEYTGRNHWKGPAVGTLEKDPNCSRADVLAATRVPCQWDNMGTDFVVYPQKREDSW